MKACRKFADQLVDLADGAASTAGQESPRQDARRQEALMAHLDHCAACRAEWSRLRKSLSAAIDVWNERAEAAAAGSRESAAVLRDNRRQQPVLASRILSAPSPRAIAAAAACVLLLVSLVVWLWPFGQGGNSLPSGDSHANGSRGDSARDSARDSAQNADSEKPNANDRPKIRDAVAAEIARLTAEIEDAGHAARQAAKLTASAEILRERPELAEEYAAAKQYLEGRGTN